MNIKTSSLIRFILVGFFGIICFISALNLYIYEKLPQATEIEEVKNTSNQRIERGKDLIKKYTKYDSIIRSVLNKDSYSLDDAEKINFKTLDVLDAIDFLKFFKKNSLSIERLEGAIKYYNNRLKYHINLDFDGRSIVGDDPNDINDTNYGNPNVIGPDKDSADHGTHAVSYTHLTLPTIA